MDKPTIKTFIKMKILAAIIILVSLILWLAAIYIIFIFMNFFSKVSSYVISIWLLLFTPLSLIFFYKKFRNSILINIFKLREMEIGYYDNLVVSGKFRSIKNKINNLSYTKSLAIIIVFTILCYLIITYLFDVSIADLPYIFTILPI